MDAEQKGSGEGRDTGERRSGEAKPEAWMDMCRGMMAGGMPDCCGAQMKRMMAAFQAAPETKAADCGGGAS